MHCCESLLDCCGLDDVLYYLLREEENADRKLQEAEKVLEPFWNQVEALFPQINRNDDRFFLLVMGLVADIEDAAFKLGFLQGFSLAQEMAGIKKRVKNPIRSYERMG